MDASHLILGGGLAGLALAGELRAAGARGRIEVLERRTEPVDDRTWCTWADGSTPLHACATATWSDWEVRDGPGRAARGRAPSMPYVRLPALAVLERLQHRAEQGGAVIRRGVRVLQTDDRGGGPVTVHTDQGSLRADHVYDAMALAGPLGRARERGAVELHQRFLGWDVEVEHPVFDPSTVTLMDFAVEQHGAVRFLYVLPMSPTRALVEDTSIGGQPLSHAVRSATLEQYLDRRGAGAVRIVREERGALLMTDGRFATGSWPRIIPVGTAAGAVRPSSGYAFTRTLRHATALARGVVDGAPRAPRPGRPALDRMDAVMLRVLQREPQLAPEIFHTLVGRVPGAAFARFMTDVPSPLDVARIVGALPKAPFSRAALPGDPARPRGVRTAAA